MIGCAPIWTVLKTWWAGGISDSIGLWVGANACGGSLGFSTSMPFERLSDLGDQLETFRGHATSRGAAVLRSPRLMPGRHEVLAGVDRFQHRGDRDGFVSHIHRKKPKGRAGQILKPAGYRRIRRPSRPSCGTRIATRAEFTKAKPREDGSTPPVDLAIPLFGYQKLSPHAFAPKSIQPDEADVLKLLGIWRGASFACKSATGFGRPSKGAPHDDEITCFAAHAGRVVCPD